MSKSRFQKTILVDCHAVGHYIKHSMRYLSHGGTSTGIIYGFLSIMKEAAEVMAPNQFVFAWDSVKSHRKRLYSDYKGNRNPEEKTEEEREEDMNMISQLHTLRDEIIPQLGFSNSFLATGLEADDIIASCAISLPGKVYIISRDNDLWQLMHSKCCMWDFQKKCFFTEGDFLDKWGIPPHRWKEVKCIAGCTSDHVPNVPGVKEKTAIKYMTGKLGHHTKAFQAIQAHKELIKNNRPLVVLPFKGTKKYVVKKDKLSIQSFWDMCDTYGFNSFLKDIDEWVEIMKMT